MWIDVVFTALYVVIVVALSGHFLGNILTGRAKRRFVGWEGPAIPATPKIMHFQHVAAMIALAVSGMYIRFPFFNGGRTAMRWVHYVAMTIVFFNLIARLWYAFGSARRDYREFAITKRDVTTAPKVILYYTFVKPSKPHLGKYNVMQKMTYILFVPLLVAQAFTGFSLITARIPVVGSPRDLLVGWWLGAMLGSTDMAGWWMRTTHYLINWLFIVLTTIHVYLSVTEDFPAFMDFFGLGFLNSHEDANGVHDDFHSGHEAPEHEPAPALVSTDHV